MKLIDGKAVSAEIREELEAEVKKLIGETGTTPGLAVVLVGEDPASKTYVASKEKACEKMGIYSEGHKLPAQTSEEELLSLIDELNVK